MLGKGLSWDVVGEEVARLPMYLESLGDDVPELTIDGVVTLGEGGDGEGGGGDGEAVPNASHVTSPSAAAVEHGMDSPAKRQNSLLSTPRYVVNISEKS